jgi:hypothetical protein
VIRSDAGKLTACREVAGFYKPCHAKSRLNDIAKAPVLQPFLALASSDGHRICHFGRESFATGRIPRTNRRPLPALTQRGSAKQASERLTNTQRSKKPFIYH